MLLYNIYTIEDLLVAMGYQRAREFGDKINFEARERGFPTPIWGQKSNPKFWFDLAIGDDFDSMIVRVYLKKFDKPGADFFTLEYVCTRTTKVSVWDEIRLWLLRLFYGRSPSPF